MRTHSTFSRRILFFRSSHKEFLVHVSWRPALSSVSPTPTVLKYVQLQLLLLTLLSLRRAILFFGVLYLLFLVSLAMPCQFPLVSFPYVGSSDAGETLSPLSKKRSLLLKAFSASSSSFPATPFLVHHGKNDSKECCLCNCLPVASVERTPFLLILQTHHRSGAIPRTPRTQVRKSPRIKCLLWKGERIIVPPLKSLCVSRRSAAYRHNDLLHLSQKKKKFELVRLLFDRVARTEACFVCLALPCRYHALIHLLFTCTAVPFDGAMSRNKCHRVIRVSFDCSGFPMLIPFRFGCCTDIPKCLFVFSSATSAPFATSSSLLLLSVFSFLLVLLPSFPFHCHCLFAAVFCSRHWLSSLRELGPLSSSLLSPDCDPWDFIFFFISVVILCVCVLGVFSFFALSRLSLSVALWAVFALLVAVYLSRLLRRPPVLDFDQVLHCFCNCSAFLLPVFLCAEHTSFLPFRSSPLRFEWLRPPAASPSIHLLTRLLSRLPACVGRRIFISSFFSLTVKEGIAFSQVKSSHLFPFFSLFSKLPFTSSLSFLSSLVAHWRCRRHHHLYTVSLANETSVPFSLPTVAVSFLYSFSSSLISSSPMSPLSCPRLASPSSPLSPHVSTVSPSSRSESSILSPTAALFSSSSSSPSPALFPARASRAAFGTTAKDLLFRCTYTSAVQEKSRRSDHYSFLWMFVFSVFLREPSSSFSSGQFFPVDSRCSTSSSRRSSLLSTTHKKVLGLPQASLYVFTMCLSLYVLLFSTSSTETLPASSSCYYSLPLQSFSACPHLSLVLRCSHSTRPTPSPFLLFAAAAGPIAAEDVYSDPAASFLLTADSLLPLQISSSVSRKAVPASPESLCLPSAACSSSSRPRIETTSPSSASSEFPILFSSTSSFFPLLPFPLLPVAPSVTASSFAPPESPSFPHALLSSSVFTRDRPPSSFFFSVSSFPSSASSSLSLVSSPSSSFSPLLSPFSFTFSSPSPPSRASSSSSSSPSSSPQQQPPFVPDTQLQNFFELATRMREKGLGPDWESLVEKQSAAVAVWRRSSSGGSAQEYIASGTFEDVSVAALNTTLNCLPVRLLWDTSIVELQSLSLYPVGQRQNEKEHEREEDGHRDEQEQKRDSSRHVDSSICSSPSGRSQSTTSSSSGQPSDGAGERLSSEHHATPAGERDEKRVETPMVRVGGGRHNNTEKRGQRKKTILKEEYEEVIYWRVKLPWPLQDRDFVYARRFRTYEGPVIVGVQQAMPPSFYPEQPRAVRVHHFISAVVLFPQNTANSCTEKGVFFIFYHYDSSRTPVPPWLRSYFAATTLPNLVTALRGAASALALPDGSVKAELPGQQQRKIHEKPLQQQHKEGTPQEKEQPERQPRSFGTRGEDRGDVTPAAAAAAAKRRQNAEARERAGRKGEPSQETITGEEKKVHSQGKSQSNTQLPVTAELDNVAAGAEGSTFLKPRSSASGGTPQQQPISPNRTAATEAAVNACIDELATLSHPCENGRLVRYSERQRFRTAAVRCRSEGQRRSDSSSSQQTARSLFSSLITRLKTAGATACKDVSSMIRRYFLTGTPTWYPPEGRPHTSRSSKNGSRGSSQGNLSGCRLLSFLSIEDRPRRRVRPGHFSVFSGGDGDTADAEIATQQALTAVSSPSFRASQALYTLLRGQEEAFFIHMSLRPSFRTPWWSLHHYCCGWFCGSSSSGSNSGNSSVYSSNVTNSTRSTSSRMSSSSSRHSADSGDSSCSAVGTGLETTMKSGNASESKAEKQHPEKTAVTPTCSPSIAATAPTEERFRGAEDVRVLNSSVEQGTRTRAAAPASAAAAAIHKAAVPCFRYWRRWCSSDTSIHRDTIKKQESLHLCGCLADAEEETGVERETLSAGIVSLRTYVVVEALLWAVRLGDRTGSTSTAVAHTQPEEQQKHKQYTQQQQAQQQETQQQHLRSVLPDVGAVWPPLLYAGSIFRRS